MDRAFKLALIFSILFHAAIIIEWPFYRHFFSHCNRYEDIEITYLRVKEPASPSPKEFSGSAKMASSKILQPARPQKSQAETSRKNSAIRTETKKKAVKDRQKISTARSPSVEVRQPLVQGLEGITPIDLKSLRFMPPSYAQAVRNKIKRNLTPAESAVEGDVFVRFVIASNGRLQELSIINEKSTRNGLLREIVFEAIKNSSPFPKFPENVMVPEMTFTCQISFEMK